MKTFIYVTGKKYDGMMGRCYRPTDRSYHRYGERGIKVCSEWIKDINSFRQWVELELQELGISKDEFVANPRQFQLDRINTDSDYTPGNCRLASPQLNGRNKSGLLKQVVSAEGEIIELG